MIPSIQNLSAAEMNQCIERAASAFKKIRFSSRFARSRLLSDIAMAIGDRRDVFRKCLIDEVGKPYRLADIEVSRAIQTFTMASEEARRFSGELVPVDLDAASRGYAPALSTWVPRGPILGITPFNFPLNLVAHKVAPALAVGASILLKPPPQGPSAAFRLKEIFDECARDEIEPDAFQVVLASNDVMAAAVEDSRLPVISFTGSDRVGWMLRQRAARKKVLLELGGNATAIVHSDADLARAAARCATAGFSYAGQTCISVQRILIQDAVWRPFQEQFLSEVQKLRVGDPREKDTLVGPLIDEHASERIEQWIREACDSGAKIVAGGTRKERYLSPTVLTDVRDAEKLVCEEVFGPVVVLEPYRDIEDAFASINRSRFGLQAGIFTNSLDIVDRAYRDLEVGAVVVNDSPSFRSDNMPYGGIKDSGDGREGVRYAMEEYCERKTLIRFIGA